MKPFMETDPAVEGDVVVYALVHVVIHVMGVLEVVAVLVKVHALKLVETIVDRVHRHVQIIAIMVVVVRV